MVCILIPDVTGFFYYDTFYPIFSRRKMISIMSFYRTCFVENVFLLINPDHSQVYCHKRLFQLSICSSSYSFMVISFKTNNERFFLEPDNVSLTCVPLFFVVLL